MVESYYKEVRLDSVRAGKLGVVGPRWYAVEIKSGTVLGTFTVGGNKA